MNSTSKKEGDGTAEILIDPSWLAERMTRPGLVILDGTVLLPKPRFDGDYRVQAGRREWCAGHIPGAYHADLVETLAVADPVCCFAHPVPSDLLARFGAFGIGEESDVVVYDRADGLWAARLWWLLRSAAVPARILDGGWRAWLEAGHPVAAGEEALPEPPERPLPAAPVGESWADRQEVLAIAERRAPGTLICALSEDQFLGRAPTRYSRRGHIPGSLNLPARALLDGQGRMRPRAELAAIVGPLIANRPRPLVLYCGGGISACVPALAFDILGIADFRIYDGSLQEWSAIAELPLVAEPA